jgi:hypothetical protein
MAYRNGIGRSVDPPTPWAASEAGTSGADDELHDRHVEVVGLDGDLSRDVERERVLDVVTIADLDLVLRI